jgi:hypothetical protein
MYHSQIALLITGVGFSRARSARTSPSPASPSPVELLRPVPTVRTHWFGGDARGEGTPKDCRQMPTHRSGVERTDAESSTSLKVSPLPPNNDFRPPSRVNNPLAIARPSRCLPKNIYRLDPPFPKIPSASIREPLPHGMKASPS